MNFKKNNLNKKNFFTIILTSILFIFFSIINIENIFAEDEVFDKTIPEITKIETVYNNKKGEFLIYGKNFGKDLDKIEVVVIPDYFDLGLGDGEKNEQKINIDKIYGTMLTGKISGDYKNGTLIIRKKIGEKENVSSNKKFFDFGLPTLKKIEALEGFSGGKKIIFSGENFKKPIYGIFGSEKIICEKESDKICEITIPKDLNLSGKIGIESYGFETLTNEEIVVEKAVDVKVTAYSNNLINFVIDGFLFKELVIDLKTKEDFDNFEDGKPMGLNSGIGVYIDGKKLEGKNSDGNPVCTVNKTLRVSCEINKDIYKKGIGYFDFFGIKTSFFSYDLSKTIPYPTKLSKNVKWSTYQDKNKKTVEGNRIYLNIGIENFDYQKSSSNNFGQSTKEDFKLFIGGKKYLQDDPDLTLSKNSAELVLSDFPSKMKGEIYFELGNIKSDSIQYDFGEYIPELYRVYKGKKEDEFVVEGKNLTNFDDLEASLKFGEVSLSTSDIKKIMTEKEKIANEEIKKYKAFKKDAEESEFPDESKISNYRDQIFKREGVLKDLENGIYERNFSDNNKREGEILIKSDTRITFKVFDPDEYGKSIGKGEYEVSVTSNGITTNKLNLFYDPNSSQNIENSYPEIEKINFQNGAGDPSKIEIKGVFLDKIKELYFTDLKAEILTKEKNKIIVEIDPEAVLRKKGTIIAKLENLTMTSNLFFYEFIDDKTNKVTLNWKKIEKEFDENGNEISENNEDDDKKVFSLLLKNTYKDLVFKNLKIKIENLEDKKLPFYNFYLETEEYGKIKGIYDEKNFTINFENLGENVYSKNIPINEDDFYNFDIVFDKINFGKGEVKISIVDLNFYNDFDFPEKISSKKIFFTKTPKFYKAEDENGKFCRELNNKGEFIKCGTEIWNGSDLEDSSFEEEVIKSDFKAPKKDDLKKGNFLDVNSEHWFAPYVENLYKRGVIEGYGDEIKTFQPLKTITRAEAVKILLVARNEKFENLNYKVFAFQDVPEGHWAKNILEFAVRGKFLTPVKNFHLNKEITRGEAVKLITKFFGRTVPEYSKYSLLDLGEHWSSNYAEYLFENKIISGVGETKEFKPNNKVTRSEFAKMISLAIDIWSK